ncbi:MAG: phosphoribosylanthranilate isomerase [Bacteroidetes bacterium]|nr:phosphoribosylanthranilate isomerase [Bacteroidota bacterium]
MFTKIKICCISSWDEARLSIDYGASALGLVSRMPSGPGVISDQLIHDIASKIPPPIASFLLTSELFAGAIITHHLRTQTNVIQLVDELSSGSNKELRDALPAIRFVQVIHVLGEESIEIALKYSEYADALLLDSGNPTLRTKELGGTGRVHNWNISRKIVDQCRIPVFLAGGLDASNAKAALDSVNPWGLDVCSGVRTDGKLDPQKLEAFFRAAGY